MGKTNEGGEIRQAGFHQGGNVQIVIYTEIVYTVSVKNITLSAPEEIIERARLVAKAQHKTLNVAFRDWLQQYAARAGTGAAVDALMRRLCHVRSSGPYSRDEMNERS